MGKLRTTTFTLALTGAMVGGLYAYQSWQSGEYPWSAKDGAANQAAATPIRGIPESQEPADLWFDPAEDVEYVAHPAEMYAVEEELGITGDGLVDWQAPPRTVLAAEIHSAHKVGKRLPAQPGARRGNDYDFPEVTAGPDGLVLTISDAPVPGVSSRRLLEAGQGELVTNGDTIGVSYDLFSWSTGQRVESSTTSVGGPLRVRLGSRDSQLPAYVDRSLQDRPMGSQVQVVLAQGTPDLPDYLNPSDGYVLVARITEAPSESTTLSAAEQAQAAARQAFGSGP